MLIVDTKVQVKLNKKIKEYYTNLNYDTNKESIMVSIVDLKPSSKIELNIICDNCGKHFLRKRCKIKDINIKQYCINCKSCSIKQSNLNKYGVENISQVPFVKEKIEHTNIKKYGHKYFTSTEEFKNKTKDTNIKKYNCEYVFQSDIVKEKIKNTNIKKYGVEHNLLIPQVINNRKLTWINNYGVEHPWKSQDIQRKIKYTNIKKYGVENPMQSSLIQNKVISTNLQRYGCKYSLQNKDVRNKIRNSMIKRYGTPNIYCKIPISNQQFYIGNLLNGKFNKYIKNGFADIVLEDKNIIIEYDGGGHDLSVKKGFPIEKFIEKEINRENSFIKEGYKIIRIISKKDLLPNDTELLNIINDCISILLDSMICLIKVDIDNSTLEIEDNIKKINFSKLRRITKEDINV